MILTWYYILNFISDKVYTDDEKTKVDFKGEEAVP